MYIGLLISYQSHQCEGISEINHIQFSVTPRVSHEVFKVRSNNEIVSWHKALLNSTSEVRYRLVDSSSHFSDSISVINSFYSPHIYT